MSMLPPVILSKRVIRAKRITLPASALFCSQSNNRILLRRAAGRNDTGKNIQRNADANQDQGHICAKYPLHKSDTSCCGVLCGPAVQYDVITMNGSLGLIQLNIYTCFCQPFCVKNAVVMETVKFRRLDIGIGLPGQIFHFHRNGDPFVRDGIALCILPILL